jgi:hypothetical protein
MLSRVIQAKPSPRHPPAAALSRTLFVRFDFMHRDGRRAFHKSFLGDNHGLLFVGNALVFLTALDGKAKQRYTWVTECEADDMESHGAARNEAGRRAHMRDQ